MLVGAPNDVGIFNCGTVGGKEGDEAVSLLGHLHRDANEVEGRVHFLGNAGAALIAEDLAGLLEGDLATGFARENRFEDAASFGLRDSSAFGRVGKGLLQAGKSFVRRLRLAME